MVKAYKVSFFVLLSIALACFAVVIILLFVPEPKPLTITEEFHLTEVDGEYFLQGKIRNYTDEELVFWSNSFTRLDVTLAGGGQKYEVELFNEKTTVAAGEEYEFSELLKNFGGDTSFKITYVNAFVGERVGRPIYGNIVNTGTYAIVAVFVGFAGLLFLVAAITKLIGNVKLAKRANKIIKNISEREGGGIYVAGYYGDKKQERADAAKNVFGILGASISLLFLGIGFYRAYGGKYLMHFFITDNALYEVYGKELKVLNILPETEFNFRNAEVTEKGQRLIMTGADGKSYFLLDANRSDADKESIKAALNNLFKG